MSIFRAWRATSLLCFVLISQTFKVFVLTVSSQCVVGLCAALKTEYYEKEKVVFGQKSQDQTVQKPLVRHNLKSKSSAGLIKRHRSCVMI